MNKRNHTATSSALWSKFCKSDYAFGAWSEQGMCEPFIDWLNSEYGRAEFQDGPWNLGR